MISLPQSASMTLGRWRSAARLLAGLLGGLLLAGCATGPLSEGPRLLDRLGGPGAARCLMFFDELDRLAQVLQVRDGGSHPVSGYPFLRADRFLASFADRRQASVSAGEDAGFATWVERMRGLDAAARAIEVANLPDSAFPLLRDWSRDEIGPQVDACGRQLTELLVKDAAARVDLRRRIDVPDDYSSLRRALGLYPLTGIGYSSSVRNWQGHTRQVFLEQRKAMGNGLIALQQYRPSDTAASPAAALARSREIMSQVPRDALGIPQLSMQAQTQLLQAFAPTFVVATGADSDRFGALHWVDLKGLVSSGSDPIWLDVDTSRPVVYHRIAFTRIKGVILPQLIYEIWFSERPKQEVGDLHGGRLDSLIWRVTLDDQGQPLIYDSIHGNGRFSMEFPTQRARPRARPEGEALIDWVFVPIDQTVERWVGAPAVAGLALFISSQTHQIVGLGQPDAVWGEPQLGNPPYALVADDQLRVLSLPNGGSRSIFDRDGIVPGSERLGRYFFWPMGVANAGAIRQWGRQPTALIGRRHFDDPDVIDRRFEWLR